MWLHINSDELQSVNDLVNDDLRWLGNWKIPDGQQNVAVLGSFKVVLSLMFEAEKKTFKKENLFLKFFFFFLLILKCNSWEFKEWLNNRIYRRLLDLDDFTNLGGT